MQFGSQPWQVLIHSEVIGSISQRQQSSHFADDEEELDEEELEEELEELEEDDELEGRPADEEEGREEEEELGMLITVYLAEGVR